MRTNRDVLTRVLIAALILMSGLALVPYLDLPRTALGWEQFVGIYSPELNVEPGSGSPGSTFTGSGSGYPANRAATIYVDGRPIGAVTTDGNGSATFYINTVDAAVSVYNVTLAVDANISATDNFELADGEPFIPAPTDPAGPTFYIVAPEQIFLPFMMKN